MVGGKSGGGNPTAHGYTVRGVEKLEELALKVKGVIAMFQCLLTIRLKTGRHRSQGVKYLWLVDEPRPGEVRFPPHFYHQPRRQGG